MPAPQLPLPQPLDPPGSFLFSDEEIAELTDEERRHGRYTLARLPEAKERSALVLLKERRPFREIGRLLGLAFETVQLIAQKHAKDLDAHYKDLSSHYRRVALYAVDRVERELPSMPLPVLPQLIKQLTDAALLQDGQATSRVEHVIQAKVVNSVEEYEREIAPIVRKIAGKVIDVPEEIHLGAGKNLPPAVAPAAADPGAPGEPGCDTESRVSGAVTQANGQAATLSGYTSSPNSGHEPAHTPPGGGVECEAEPRPPLRDRDA